MHNKTFEKTYSYDNVVIKLASPEKIREWSCGEVIKPDTLNYRTHKPEKDGLFCEKIFGPEKDYECSCGKYKKKRFYNMVCDRCGVEITSSRVRRTRMGHIELVIPIAHIWFVKSAPSKIGTLLDMTIRNLEKIIYYNGYIVFNQGNTDYNYMDVIEIDDYLEAKEIADNTFEAKTGSEAIYELLKGIDLEDEIAKIQSKINIETSVLKKAKAISKLKLLNAFYESGNRPEWMIMEVLPVLPPTLRPIVALEGGKFAAADFNDLYRRVITRNNRLKYLLEINAPEVILKNEKRMLQEAVDALLDNARKTRPIKGRGGRELKSLTDQLKGKQGRFRQNLLGKRVDYSGRSVISVDPELKLSECGLPKEMAIELFKPYIIERLEYYGEAEKTKTAKKILEKKQPQIWKILEEVIKDHPVLLNRAPTLHRLGIQAFQPVLTEDKAIKLHPMVCTPYNADFDGDQMAVYVPLSLESQLEARMLMSPTKNLLLPSNGKLAMAANQDIVLGSYYLTMEREHLPVDEEQLKKLKYFSSYKEVILYYDRQESYYREKDEEKYDFLHKWIKFYDKENKYITTIGRVIFNNIIPSKIFFQNKSFTKGDLNSLAMVIYEKVGQERTAKFLDDLKKLSFLYATKSGVTFSARDVIVPKEKEAILNKATEDINVIKASIIEGKMEGQELFNRTIDIWKKATNDITEKLMDEVAEDQKGLNSIHLMHISGARGGKDQIKQLGAMRGLMAKPSVGVAGEQVIETPIKSNFKEGLNVLEYFISTHGSRKGLSDTALKTANAGYLTRRLVDVAQNAYITMEDCGTIEGLEIRALKEGMQVIEPLSERIQGRIAAEDIIDENGKIILEAGEEISNDKAKEIDSLNIAKVKIRTVLTCEAKRGICAKCYGRNLADLKPVTIGEPVGIIAAQSIGEPGTQLTLRTFHFGGAVSSDVESSEVVSKSDGIIKLEKINVIQNKSGDYISVSNKGKIKILEKDTGKVLESHEVQYASTLYVKNKEEVMSNTMLCSWNQFINPILATIEGIIEYDNFVKDITYKEDYSEETGTSDIVIIESKNSSIQPQIKIKKDDEHMVNVPLATGLIITVEDGAKVFPGDIIGKSSRISDEQSDITGGLPRIQELFEARVPKDKSIVTEVAGKVVIGDIVRNGRLIYVETENGEKKKYIIPPGKRIIVHGDESLDAGDPLSSGVLDPHDILKAKGIKAAQSLIMNGIQEVYRKQGVKIDDKHIGIIIRQMLKKIKIISPGDTLFLEGELVDKNKVIEINSKLMNENKKGASFEQVLLGITKASLLIDSWLSAASFQETTKVLTQAAIEGKVDILDGLKENIIIGNKIPVGTGSKDYLSKIKEAEKQGLKMDKIVKTLLHSKEEKKDVFDIVN